MRRIDLLLKADEFPEDVAALKRGIACLRKLPDGFVERLYSDWSQMEYSAGWMMLTAQIMERFGEWLNEDE